MRLSGEVNISLIYGEDTLCMVRCLTEECKICRYLLDANLTWEKTKFNFYKEFDFED